MFCAPVCWCVLLLFHEDDALLPGCPARNIISAQYRWYFLGWPSTVCISPYRQTHRQTDRHTQRTRSGKGKILHYTLQPQHLHTVTSCHLTNTHCHTVTSCHLTDTLSHCDVLSSNLHTLSHCDVLSPTHTDSDAYPQHNVLTGVTLHHSVVTLQEGAELQQ